MRKLSFRLGLALLTCDGAGTPSSPTSSVSICEKAIDGALSVLVMAWLIAQ